MPPGRHCQKKCQWSHEVPWPAGLLQVSLPHQGGSLRSPRALSAPAPGPDAPRLRRPLWARLRRRAADRAHQMRDGSRGDRAGSAARLLPRQLGRVSDRANLRGATRCQAQLARPTPLGGLAPRPRDNGTVRTMPPAGALRLRDGRGPSSGCGLLVVRGGGGSHPVCRRPRQAEQTRGLASRSFVQWRAPPGRQAPRPLHVRVGRRQTGWERGYPLLRKARPYVSRHSRIDHEGDFQHHPTVPMKPHATKRGNPSRIQ